MMLRRGTKEHGHGTQTSASEAALIMMYESHGKNPDVHLSSCLLTH